MYTAEEIVPQMKLDKAGRHGLDLKDSATPPAQKLKFKFDSAPRTSTEYPKVKYHPIKGRLVVASAEEEAILAPVSAGWVNTPADFPPGPMREFSVADKLDLLESLGVLIASEAKPEETLPDALCRLIQERNDFAVVVAKTTGADPRKKGK